MNTQPMPIEPGFEAPFTFEDKVRWLLLNYGYCAPLNKVVVLHATGDDCLRKWGTFKFTYAGWHKISVGPKGGKKITFATDVWAHSSDRLNIEKVEMRAGRPFLIYYNGDGRLCRNTSTEVQS
jgi:hypothetical protein